MGAELVRRVCVSVCTHSGGRGQCVCVRWGCLKWKSDRISSSLSMCLTSGGDVRLLPQLAAAR